MTPETIQTLLDLNHRFYEQFATMFHESRIDPADGFTHLANWLPEQKYSVLDVGCGNGRFGYFWQAHGRLGRYVGVDYSQSYMGKAQIWGEQEQARAKKGDREGQIAWAVDVPWQFRPGNMMTAGFLEGLEQFELVTCLSAMHHVPTRARRVALLQELAQKVAPAGYLVVGNWQFLSSKRQQRKLLPWSTIGLSEQEVEPDDYLLSWQKGGFGYRYVCLIDEAEMATLAQAAGVNIVHQFRSDGVEGNLNLYTIMQTASAR